MSTELDAMYVRFEAQIGEMRAAFSELDTRFQKFAAGVERSSNRANASFRGLSRMFTLTAATAGIRSLINYETQLENVASQLKDTALRANVSYEALQRLRFAADQNGGSAQALDVGLVKLNRAMGQAAGGAKNMQRLFQTLGLEDLRASGATTEQMFYALADALTQVKDDGMRSQIAFALLGKSGDALVEMLSHGSAGLREMADALSAAAVKDEELIDKLDASHDKTQLFTEMLSGVASMGAGVFVDLVVGISEFVGWLEKTYGLLTQVKGAWEGFAGVVGGGIDKGLTWAGVTSAPQRPTPLGSPEDALAQFGPTAAGVRANTRPRRAVNQSGLGALFGGGGAGAAGGDSDAARVDRVIRSLEIERDTFDKSAEAIAFETAMKQANGKATAEQEAYIRQLTHEITANAAETQRHNDEIERSAQDYADVQQWIERTATSQEREAEGLARLNELRASGKMDAETYARAVEQISEASQAQQSFAEQFADNASSVAVGLETWQDALKGLLVQLAKAILQATILRALGYGDSAGAGGIGGTILNAIAGGHAGGGSVSPGNAYMVGERGPEPFVPKVPGRILPAGSPVGGLALHLSQAFNFDGVNPATVAMLRSEAGRIKDQTLRAVPQLMRELQLRNKLGGAF